MMQPALAAPLYVEVVITADDVDTLEKMIRTLVEERIVAYGYTTTPVEAVFHEDGEVQTATHARGILHTRATLVSDVVDRLDHDHPDELRSVVATQLVDGRSDYLRWVARETSADVDHHATVGRRRTEHRQEPRHWSWSR